MAGRRSDDELRSRLEVWDPAKDAGPPAPATLARIRRAMLDAPATSIGTARLVWATAAVALTAVMIVWQLSLPRNEMLASVDVTKPVRMQFQASNGTRIYWTVQPAIHDPLPGNGENHE